MLREAKQLVKKLRTNPPEGCEQRTCMRFFHDSGVPYIYNFATNTEVQRPSSRQATPSGTSGGAPNAISSTNEPAATTSSTQDAHVPAADSSTAAAPSSKSNLSGSQAQQVLPDSQMVEEPPDDLFESYGFETRPRSASDVQRLRFYSWWYEDTESKDLTFRVNVDSVVGGGLTKRYVTVDYDIASSSFSVCSANEDQELIVSNLLAVTTKLGGTVEVWDLYVGATLDILGRSVTLLKADLDTAQWNDFHAKRLKKLKAELQAELQKYKPRSHSNSLMFDRGDKVHNGGLCLRFVVNQIQAMVEDLKQYRPVKAETYRKRIGIAI